MMKFLKFTIYTTVFLSVFCVAKIAKAVYPVAVRRRFWLNGLLFIFFIFLTGLSFVSSASGATNVYYSVGQTAADLKTGSPTIGVSGTAVTFSTDQTGNIGVGDVITYDTDNKKCYISGKTSTLVWSCVSATGGTAPNVGVGTTVNSITRAFTSLSAAEAGASGINYLNDADLTNGNYILNLPCYYDTGPDTNAVTIDGWTTGPNNYIKVYTPNDVYTEVNKPQRHSGKWDEGKYNISATPSYGTPIVGINAEYVRITGLQISTSLGGRNAIDLLFDDPDSEIIINQNIIRSTDPPELNQYGINVYQKAIKLKVDNNIFYGTSRGIEIQQAKTGSDILLYNNTLIDCVHNGIRITEGWPLSGGTYTVRLKNDLIQGYSEYGNLELSLNSSVTSEFKSILTEDDKHDSVQAQTSDCGGQSCQNKVVTFVDANNKDYHLAAHDTAAKSSATNLYVDTYLPITTDVDSAGRPNSSSTLSWDIGADQTPRTIYRSVGPGATGNLNTDSRTVTISGTTATFSGAMPDNVGVGDVLQYQVTGTYYAAIIQGRTSSSVYTVANASGETPQAAAAGTSVSVYRAYTSLSNAESSDENNALDDSVENFDTWTNGRNLLTNNEQWNIAAYANGTTADTTPVYTDDWTTSPTNYLRFYTPYLTSEVGTSQRHSGKWDDSKFKLEPVGHGIVVDYPNLITPNQVRIEGLQIKINDNMYRKGIWFAKQNADSESDYQASYNIVRSTPGNSQPYKVGIAGFSYNGIKMKVWNNIIYDFNGTDSKGIFNDNNLAVDHIYNNTIVNCSIGISNSWRRKDYLVNNMVLSASQVAFQTDSVYARSNLTDSGTAPQENGVINTENNKINQAVQFIDSTNKDFHLDVGDTAARGWGINLTNDANLSFQDDIDGQSRAGNWDIGADQIPRSEANVPSVGLDDGLVLYQTFDGQYISGSSAIDSSGEGNNGLISGATKKAGRIGQTLDFIGVGVSSYLDVSGSFPNGTSSRTISAWFKVDSDHYQLDYNAIFAYDYSGPNGTSFELFYPRYNTHKLELSFYHYGLETVGNPIELDTWYNVAVVVPSGATSTSDVLLYLNGSLQSLTPTGGNGYGPFNTASSNITIGAREMPDDSHQLFFDGLVDEFRVYNRALSGAEIAELYRVGQTTVNESQATKSTNGLVLMQTFDGQHMDWSQTSAEARDQSGNNFHGNVINASPKPGKIGQALNFVGVGSTSYINLGTSAALQPSIITVSGWLKRTSTWNDTQNPIIWAKGTPWDGNGWYLESYDLPATNYDSGLIMVVDSKGGFRIHTAPDTLFPLNEWTHFAVTFNSTSNAYHMYINGTEATTESCLGLGQMTDPESISSSSSNTKYIGRKVQDNVYLNGMLDEVRIYSQELTAKEVGDLYQMGQATMER
jgi:hypothetical protein